MIPYPLAAERRLASTPEACRHVDVLIVGAGIGLASAGYLMDQAARTLARPLSVAVVDAGPLDLLTHLAHTPEPDRAAHLDATDHVGGKLTHWGVSTPRPPERLLRRWPYPFDDLIARFAAVEGDLGVPDAIPRSGGELERDLIDTLRARFPRARVGVAPVAIDRDGRRYSPLRDVPGLVERGLRLLPRFSVRGLERQGPRITAVRGAWLDGRAFTLHPETVVLAVGVWPSLPLLRAVSATPMPLETADHLRIDMHGRLPTGHPWAGKEPDRLGVGVLLLEDVGGALGVPFHLGIKVAPARLWARGYLPSSDNLRVSAGDEALYVQVQAVSAMHDRLFDSDPLSVAGPLSPVMSSRDTDLHVELIHRMKEVAEAIGLLEPRFNVRPLLSNHHCYGAFRVGRAVTAHFRWHDLENLYVLPPAAFVDVDDNASPTLKSLTLARYASDAIVAQYASRAPGPRG